MVQQHVAVDATEAPEVLIFQVTAVAVLIHLDGYLVLTFLNIGGDVELRRLHRALTVAYTLAVDPHVEGAHDTLEAQERLPAGCRPAVGQRKSAAVLSRRVALHIRRPVLLRLPRHVWRVDLEWVAGRDINRRAVAVHLPVGRDGQRLPPRGVIVSAPKILDALFGRLRPSELPVAVERQHAVSFPFTKGYKIGTGRFPIDLQHMVVLPVVMLFFFKYEARCVILG